MFVAKTGTMFGTGVNRLSRCATLHEVNSLLGSKDNWLSDVGMAAKDVEARATMLQAATRIWEHNRDDALAIDASRTVQTVSASWRANLALDEDEAIREQLALKRRSTRCRWAP